MFKKMSKWKGIILLSITMLSMQFAKAATWVDPATPPTDGNVQAPINTGSAAQTKDGAFYSNTGIMTNNGGSIISSGLIKTTASGYAQSVAGDISGKRLCINNTCIQSWGDISGGGGWGGSGIGTTNYITKWINSTTIGNSIIFDNGTTVGVNTTSPVSDNGVVKLDVNGAVRIRSNGIISGYGRIDFLTDDLSSASISAGNIQTNGFIGIGTTPNSTYALDVNGTGRFGANALIGSSIASGFYMDATNGAYRALNVSNAGYYFQTSGGGATQMYVGLTGTYAGKVGIGTGEITPQRTLDVAGDVRFNNVYSGSSYIGFLTDAANALPIKAASLALTSSYATNAPANGLYVQGNAQIGTTNSTYGLEVGSAGIHSAGVVKADGNMSASDIYLTGKGKWVGDLFATRTCHDVNTYTTTGASFNCNAGEYVAGITQSWSNNVDFVLYIRCCTLGQ